MHKMGLGGHMEKQSAREIAWRLFEETGNMSYYMLYHRLGD